MSDPRAIYAGSFDLLTKGHLWMIEEGVQLFGTLTVAIGVNQGKKTTFTLEERAQMVRECTAHLGDTVKVVTFEREYLANYAARTGHTHLLRGIRDDGDARYERIMRHINEDIAQGVRTVFLMPPRQLAEVSSSMVKELIGPEGWTRVVGAYVPIEMYEALLAHFGDEEDA